jgi:hypothetical protein
MLSNEEKYLNYPCFYLLDKFLKQETKNIIKPGLKFFA